MARQGGSSSAGRAPRAMGLAVLCVLALLALPGGALGRFLVPGAGSAAGGSGSGSAALTSPARRRLAAASADSELVRQCDWAPGNRCVLGAEFASATLGAVASDPVAQYVSKSLECARATAAAACNADASCAWDASFSDGQQGCFLSEAAQLSVQQMCVQPRYTRALTALQACVAQRRSCQCTDAASCDRVAAAGACQPLLGCWLARLQGSPYDVMQLAQVQMLRVGPLLSTLQPNALAVGLAGGSAGGGRRRLLQPTGLNDPVYDDVVKKKNAAAAAAAAAPPAAAAPAPVPADAGGQNKPILSDAAASMGGGGSSSSSSSGGTSTAEVGNLEAGQLLDAGIIQADTTTATQTDGSSTDSSSSSSSDAVSMTYAPPAFWKCLADAATTADRTTDWASIDYNSKKLTLDTWLKVIRKLSLLDWGVKVLECYKQQAAAAKQGGAGAAPDGQTQESYEFAIVSLIRAFGGMATQFNGYVQSGAAPAARAAAATAGMQALAGQLLPDAVAALAKQYNSSAAYNGDVLLQARALLADAQWFVSEAAAVGADSGEPVAAYEAVMGYSVEQMRRLLRWLFAEQFGGPRAYLPTAPPTTPAGLAAAQALGALAAAQLPAAGVALSEPRWLQARAMGTHALLTSALEAAALPPGAAANATLAAASAVTAMSNAHVADFWGARVEAARAAADPSLLALALDARGPGSRGWRNAALGFASALGGLRGAVALQGGDTSVGATAAALAGRMRDGFARSLAGVALAANDALPDDAADGAAAASQRAAALADAALACYGAGASAAGAAHAAGCATLVTETGALVKDALGADLAPNDPLYAAASDGAALQWRCSARPAASCAALPGCARALLPSAPVPSGGAAYPSAAPLPAPGQVAACQSDDSRLSLRRADNATKAALASSPACAAFLQLPACEAVPAAGGAAACEALSACSWQPRGSRYFILSQDQAAASAAAAAGPDGTCATDWATVLQGVSGAQLRGSLSSATATCAGQKAADACSSLRVEVLLPTAGRGPPPPARVLAPALAVAAFVAVMAAAGAAWLVRRRRAAAADASDSADAADGGAAGGSGGSGSGSGKKRKGSKKRVWKRKIKRAEPGEYKPDLMRDSFTDYLSRPAFRAGVAIASANMAGGGAAQEFENPLASLRDEVGGSNRLLLEPTLAFISGARPAGAAEQAAWQAAQLGGGGGSGSGGGGSGALIDLGSSELQEDDGAPLASRRAGGSGAPVPQQGQGRQQQQQQAPLQQQPSQGGDLQPQFSYNPFQPGARPAAPAAGAPPSDTLAAARESYGASSSLARAAAGAPHARLPRIATHRRAGGRPPLLAPQSSVGTDGAESSQGGSPTSSCCHDSVCTFRVAVPGAPGSTAGSVAGSLRGVPRGGGGGGAPSGLGALSARRETLESAQEREEEDEEAGAGGGGARQGRGLSLSRTSWASQDLLVSVPSSGPPAPPRQPR